MRLIDADALLKEVIYQGKSAKEQGFVSVYNGLAIACGEIINAPTIEAEPVRHGHWVRHPAFDDFDICSVCGTGCRRRFVEDGGLTEYGYPRCPHCGAIMDEVILTSEGE